MPVCTRFLAFLFLIYGVFASDRLEAQCNFYATYSTNPQPPYCAGTPVTITAVPNGGTPPYTYAWNTGHTTASITQPINMITDYYATITDANGCTGTVIAHLKPVFYAQSIETSTTEICAGDSVQVWPYFGTGTYSASYLWSTGETSYDIFITQTGTYSVTLTDPATGCTASTSLFIPVTTNPRPPLSITGPTSICAGQSVTLSVNPSNYNYYVWYPGGSLGTTFTTTWPGTYSVWGNNGGVCEGYAEITITEGPGTPPQLTGGTIPCSGGSATVSVTNSSSFSGFLWSNGQTTSSISVNQPGTYTVTVTAGGSCTGTGSYTVTGASGNLSIATATTPAGCGQTNGAANITVTPAGSYTFLWSTGATTEDLTNLAAGTYSVTATSSGGCTGQATVTVPAGGTPPTLNANTTPVSVCSGPANGAVNLTVSPAGTYTYAWSNGATTEDLANVAAGTYTVTVNAGNGCSASASYTVSAAATPPIATATATAAACNQTNGAINLTVSGATAPYSYLWSTGATTEDLQNLAAGAYTVTVTAANRCTATTAATVPANNAGPAVNGVTAANTSCATPTGSINLTVTPSGTYGFAWSNGATTEDLAQLAAGTYAVTVTAANGCSSTANFTVTSTTASPALTTAVTPASCGQSTGAVDLTVSPAAGNAYLWSTGATMEDLQNLSAGAYTVTVTAANGCTATTAATVPANNAGPTVNGVTAANTSCATPTGSINLTVTPAGTYGFAWSNGATTEDLAQLAAGTYAVTVTAANGCSSTANFTVTSTTASPALTTAVTPAACGQSTGAVDLTVSPAVGNAYLWSTGATTEDLQNLAAGAYTVTVTAANGCTATTAATVPANNAGPTVNGVTAANTSCATPTGSINLTVTPAGTYGFAWSTGATTEDLAQLAAGTYAVTVTAANGCSSTANFTVTSTTASPALTTAVTPAACSQSTGAVDLTVSPAAGNAYLWSTGATTEDLQDLAAGAYTVTVTAANGCTATTAATVPANNAGPAVNGVTAANTSCATPTGSINLTVTPAGTYGFAWSNGATTEDLAQLAAGTYAVTVTATNGCSSTVNFTITSTTASPALTTAVTPAACGQSTGGVDLTVSPAAGNAYLWSTGATTEDLQNLSAGAYTVTVTAANGCTATTAATVPANNAGPALNGVTAVNTSCATPTGSINLSVTPAGTYGFLWSTGATTEDLAQLAAGTYAVTVTAVNGCSSTANFTVTSTTPSPALTIAVTPAACGQSTGTVDLTVSPAAGNAYLWSTGATTEDLQNLAAGAYTVTVTATNGCTATTAATVPANNAGPALNGITAANTSCATPTGSINLTVTPTGTYGFAWSTGAMTEDLAQLAAGTYAVTVTAANGCSSTANFTITSTTASPALTIAVTPAACGQSTGAVDLTVSPAAGNTYLWSTGATTEDLQNLAAGAYTVTVTAPNGCTATTDVLVENNSVTINLAAQPTPNSGCSGGNGAIDLSVMPAGAYTFEWSTGVTTEDLSGLSAGTYGVTVTSAGGCTATAAFTVDNNSLAPSLSPTPTAATCGAANGAIELTVDGGIAPFTFSWSNGANTEDVSALSPGTYSVTVSGANGCSAVATTAVADDPLVFALSGQTTPNTACNGANGSVSVSAAPAGIYSFSWSNGATTPMVTGVPAGDYTVTVSAGGTCTTTAEFSVAQSTVAPALATTTTPDTCNAGNGGVMLTVDFSGTYSVLWSNGATIQELGGIAAGTYSVTVTADNGCTATASANVANNSLGFSLDAMTSASTACVGGNGSIDLTLTPAGAYAILWSTGATTEDLLGLSAGDYTVTVSTAGSCTASAVFSVLENAAALVVGGSVTDVGCFGGADGQIVVDVAGNTGPFTYQWTPNVPGNPSSSVNLGAGSYAVTATDAAGCTGTAVFTVGEPPALALACQVSTQPSTPNAADGAAIITAVGGVAPYTVSYAPGGTAGTTMNGSSQVLSGLGAGNYAVTLTDANGCPADCGFTLDSQAPACVTAIGSISTAAQTACGVTCIAVGYDDAGEFLDGDDAVQFVLHTGTGTAIVGEIARSAEPMFCFLPGVMNYGTTYYISAVAGSAGSTGWVDLDDPCTVVTLGAPLTFYEQPVVSATGQSITCLQPTATLSALSSVGGSLFQWTAGPGGGLAGNINMPTVTATNGGVYSVVAALNGCSDTAAVEVMDMRNQPEVAIVAPSNPVLDCQIDAIDLAAVSSGTTYGLLAWSVDGVPLGAAGTLTADQPGTYLVIVADTVTHCADTASIEVFQAPTMPVPTVVVDPPRCGGDANGAIHVETDPAFGPYSFRLNDAPAVSSPVFLNLPAGAYAVEVLSDQGCSWTSELTIADPPALSLALTADLTTVQLGESVRIEAALSVSPGALDTVIWSPAGLFECAVPPCLEHEFVPVSTTEIGITVVDTNGCAATDRVAIVVQNDGGVYIPNVFSPNGDGQNDYFDIVGSKAVDRILEIQVFERWGGQVFYQADYPPNSPLSAWDGSHRGKPLDPDVFVYWARVRFIDGTERLYKGDVTLVR